MNSIRTWGHDVTVAPPRVRDQARETLALIAFSATTSIAAAVGFVVLARFGGLG